MFPLEGSSLLCTAYTCNNAHYIYWKLIVHIEIENSTLPKLEVECSTVCRATANDQAMLVVTDLEKYTSYKNACTLLFKKTW